MTARFLLGECSVSGHLELSIVLPAYNEEGRIGQSLHTLDEFLRAQGIQAEILVVDDGSSDATAQAAGEAASECRAPVRVISYRPNRGKGYAVRTGIAHGRGRYLGFTDADLPIDLAHIPEALDLLRAEADMVVGSKWMRGAECIGVCPLRRRAMSRALNLLTRGLLLLPFADTQCGFKFMTRELVEAVLPLLQAEGFGFDMELLYVARVLGYRIVEIPVRWQNPYGTSSVHPLRDGLQILREIFAIRMRALTGQYRTPVPDYTRG